MISFFKYVEGVSYSDAWVAVWEYCDGYYVACSMLVDGVVSHRHTYESRNFTIINDVNDGFRCLKGGRHYTVADRFSINDITVDALFGALDTLEMSLAFGVRTNIRDILTALQNR